VSPLLYAGGLDFELPSAAEATTPPERRGLTRDGVRLLVARGTTTTHHGFADLPDVLAPGDLVVVNTSATLPAAIDAARGDGRLRPVHVSTELDDGRWVIEPRRVDNAGPAEGVRAGAQLSLPGGFRLTVEAAYPDPTAATSRLWTARPEPAIGSATYLSRHGRPIRYGYVAEPWPLADYQTVYATHPGSAEMPSAGRPLTERILVRLMAAGVAIAPVVLHCGVSSPEAHEPPTPERFDVPAATARLADATRAAGGRVVAIGTTVVRALESAVDASGSVRPASGWTDLVLGPQQPARVVTGLLTGLHEPGASHLDLLEAVAGAEAVRTVYAAALDQGYLWHEFGDTTLFLP
jgi:S-adenosylmethionine:tRNA ribosyltransferase-isomerase